MGLALEPNIGACDTSQGFVFVRPGGPIENSPRREPWGRGHPPHAQPRQGRQRLLPEIPLVVRDPMRLQEGEEFLLQGNRAWCCSWSRIYFTTAGTLVWLTL